MTHTGTVIPDAVPVATTSHRRVERASGFPLAPEQLWQAILDDAGSIKRAEHNDADDTSVG